MARGANSLVASDVHCQVSSKGLCRLVVQDPGPTDGFITSFCFCTLSDLQFPSYQQEAALPPS